MGQPGQPMMNVVSTGRLGSIGSVRDSATHISERRSCSLRLKALCDLCVCACVAEYRINHYVISHPKYTHLSQYNIMAIATKCMFFLLIKYGFGNKLQRVAHSINSLAKSTPTTSKVQTNSWVKGVPRVAGTQKTPLQCSVNNSSPTCTHMFVVCMGAAFLAHVQDFITKHLLRKPDHQNTCMCITMSH